MYASTLERRRDVLEHILLLVILVYKIVKPGKIRNFQKKNENNNNNNNNKLP